MNSKADLRNTIINFKVDGAAVPKQRPRISGRRAYTPKRTKDYEERVLNEFCSSYKGFYPAFGKDVPVRICISVVVINIGHKSNFLKEVKKCCRLIIP